MLYLAETMKNLVLSLNFNLRYNEEAKFYYKDSEFRSLGSEKTRDLKLKKEGGRAGRQLCVSVSAPVPA